jgi:hypothetical protein
MAFRAAAELYYILYARTGTNTGKSCLSGGEVRDMLQELVNDFISEKRLLSRRKRNQGQKVVDEAKNKAERLLEDVDELLEQIRGKKG